MTRPRLLLATIAALGGCAEGPFADLRRGAAPAAEARRRAEEQALSDAEALRQLREEMQRPAEPEDGA